MIPLSEAFRAFWNDLADDLGVSVDVLGSADPFTSSRTAVLVLAAGGAEAEAIRWLETRRLPGDVAPFVVGTDPGRRTAMRVLTAGAKDYFALPDDLEIFRHALTAALTRATARKVESSASQRDAFDAILGESRALKDQLARAARLLPHRNARALILGETGTGKELLARAIHHGGPRRDAPFVAVNCSALPEHLIESELFGHERGAFTDAHASKPGLFEVADTGTLFLDEVGDLSLGVQAKLLRALEDKQIRRVGGTKWRAVDVRIVAATNEQLLSHVQGGSFREDLYFRLSTVVLTLPPLRERGNDAVLLARALIEELAGEYGLPVPELTPAVADRLLAYSWPGNVRELKNAVERALLLSPPGELSLEELLPDTGVRSPDDHPIPFPAPLHEITAAAARATVELCHGNRSESARRLVISPRRLRRLLSEEADPGEDGGEDLPAQPASPPAPSSYRPTPLDKTTMWRRGRSPKSSQ